MPLIVHTAPMGFDDSDILIISRKFNEKLASENWPDGHRGVGIHFCPSKRLQDARWKRCRFNLAHEHDDEWSQYFDEYRREMRQSYVRNRKAWDELLKWERVVIVSKDDSPYPGRSPRIILAQSILPKLGATYAGELG